MVGAVTADGEAVLADLVVDAAGRNSPVGRMLRDLGAPGPLEERDESGFLAYTRCFRAARGTESDVPPWPGAHYESVSTISCAGDSGIRSVSFFVSGEDRACGRSPPWPLCWRRRRRRSAIRCWWNGSWLSAGSLSGRGSLGHRARSCWPR
ncbi:hypothetical protein TU94_24980 [Streptomyces cyaneogriseus subsp. noncyanogenus]|uniref:FAD-binding domain-containing protein n=1 Tax=Streptomyces cyaneogriseus subsp. noncyanogenus TaxID=477245 RepID=A0A0C5G7E9_9ACTN|nr:hypothetical protein [Streptomyces cyaneogriseus]AJP04234.1 hypothetical protein TU94_24980 [Streptomyces cyaneogriseus subsp. noncyanogenus]